MLKRVVPVAAVVMSVAGSVIAGNWHRGESLQCGECHAEHATAGGQVIPGGPFSTLLIKSSVNELCLSCHGGDDPTAPDVLSPVSMYAQSLTTESAAGFFQVPGVLNPMGHSLGLAVNVPLNSAGKNMELSCASCHEYHGNDNYRNLRYDPGATGDSISILSQQDIFWQDAPPELPSQGGAALAYQQGNIRYKSSWTRWCASCHDQISANTSAIPPAHFNAHPSDVPLSGTSGTPHVRTQGWISGDGEGFAGNAVVSGEGIPRVPFCQPTATDFASAGNVHSSNEVSCGSCHKSHGSDYSKSLRWPYLEGGINYLSGCQQCHGK